MNGEQYKTEVDKRGGRKAVAVALGISLSVIDRRCAGEVPVKAEAERSLLALPERRDWRALRRLKDDPGYRAAFRKRLAGLAAVDPARAAGEALLAEAAACVPGRKPAKNNGKPAGK